MTELFYGILLIRGWFAEKLCSSKWFRNSFAYPFIACCRSVTTLYLYPFLRNLIRQIRVPAKVYSETLIINYCVFAIISLAYACRIFKLASIFAQRYCGLLYLVFLPAGSTFVKNSCFMLIFPIGLYLATM